MDVSDTLWFRLLAGLLVGLALGSFTTMLSYRLPRRLSIIQPRSHCPRCNTSLKSRDLVPVWSWLVEKGRCRHCGKPISPRYLLTELATAAACIIAFVTLGFQLALIAALVAIVAFMTLATINNSEE
ncbi:MAG: prepilin peptidase [Pseudomonadota bacterium]|nr:prepilin peptidase [Pseudomonadota bacterium]